MRTLGAYVRLKKAFLILAAVVLAPVLVVGYVLLAAGEWHAIGQTQAGGTVSISAVRALRKNERVALVRVQYKDPVLLAQGGPFVEMRARVRFNCTTGAASPTSEWFYSRDRNGRLGVSKKASHDSDFGKEAEGGFAGLVSQNVCGQK